MRDRFAIEMTRNAPVAQHHDAVDALFDFMQAMRDEDDPDAAELEVTNDVQKTIGL